MRGARQWPPKPDFSTSRHRESAPINMQMGFERLAAVTLSPHRDSAARHTTYHFIMSSYVRAGTRAECADYRFLYFQPRHYLPLC